MFGTDDWMLIGEARRNGVLDAATARREYTNLMRWRIENDLGYKRTHSIEVKNTSGAYLYDLIFATDNATGDKIMADIYNRALAENENMRKDALERRREMRTGATRLFDVGMLDSNNELTYVHEPPQLPYGRR